MGCGLLARLLPDTAVCPACWHWTPSLQQRASGTWRPGWSHALAPSAGQGDTNHTAVSLQCAPKHTASVASYWVYEFTQQNQEVVRWYWPSPVWRERVSSGLSLWTAWSACWLDVSALWLYWEPGKACGTKSQSLLTLLKWLTKNKQTKKAL